MTRPSWPLALCLAIFLVLFCLQAPARAQASLATEARLFPAPVELRLSQADAADPQAAAGIDWQQDYETGLKMADRQDKKLYLHFFTDWCHYCKVMAEKTFTNDQVVAFLNQNFIAVRIDSEKNRDLSQKFNVRGVPVSVFLEADGDAIGAKPGYLTTDQFLKTLEFVHGEQYK